MPEARRRTRQKCEAFSGVEVAVQVRPKRLCAGGVAQPAPDLGGERFPAEAVLGAQEAEADKEPQITARTNQGTGRDQVPHSRGG